MNTLEAIHSRRSIRKFTQQAVPYELIKELISAAMSAPSARNEQPWHFLIIDKKELLNKISLFCPYAAMCKDSPVSILICGDQLLEKSPGNWPQDCSAATQNLLLAAHEKDLGGVWTGVYPSEERINGFRSLFDLKQNIIPFSLVVIGYPAEKIPPQNRLKEDRIHINKW